MWFVLALIVVAAFVFIMQFAARLEGESFGGLRKLVQPGRAWAVQGAVVDSAFEPVSGQCAPYFATILVLSVTAPGQLQASWKVAHRDYAWAVQAHDGQGSDLSKALLRLHYQGRLCFKEEYPLRLSRGKIRLFVQAAGCSLYAELGFYNASGEFIVLARSNTVTMPA